MLDGSKKIIEMDWVDDCEEYCQRTYVALVNVIVDNILCIRMHAIIWLLLLQII